MSTAKSIICSFFEHNLPKPTRSPSVEQLTLERTEEIVQTNEEHNQQLVSGTKNLYVGWTLVV